MTNHKICTAVKYTNTGVGDGAHSEYTFLSHRGQSMDQERIRLLRNATAAISGLYSLQCFDIVSWVTGRAPGLETRKALSEVTLITLATFFFL